MADRFGLTALVAVTELRRRARDRSLLVLGVLAPFAMAAVIAGALGGDGGFRVRLLVVDEDRTDLTGAVVQGLLGDDEPPEGGVTFEVAPGRAEARRAVAGGEAGGALVVPQGFSAAATGAGPRPELEVLTDPGSPVGGEVTRSVARAIAARFDTGRLAVATAVAAEGGAAPGRVADLGRAAAVLDPAVDLAQADPGEGGRVDLAGYFATSMAMVFLFFTVGAGARGLLAERREGTLARLRASALPASSLLAGKATATVLTGLASLVVLWGATTALLGARWGDPAGVLALHVALVIAVAGIAAVLAVVARTDQQVETLTAVTTFGLALLGGNFLDPASVPDVLRRLSLLTPNGWALRAYGDLSAGDAGLAGVVPAVGVLLAIGLVCGGVALGRMRRMVVA